MNYNEGIEFAKQKYTEALENNNKLRIDVGFNIILTFPGKKANGDYVLSCDEVSLTHYDLCEILNNMVKNEDDFNSYRDFLEDVYLNGTNNNQYNEELTELQNLIFWMTLQEEINYPRRNGKAGINLPFTRYYEAIYCAVYDTEFDIMDVLRRCRNNGREKPDLFDIQAPMFYHY